ncbi:MFS transporter [Tessaracoccus caeni]|uniref:MFS transporter n=1 Tax=Tessaracoccus caeni TaxID=3031239 RepID=UPI0023DCD85A|nr:MFS transporter [Tessaracoccus caeni]MDF1487455.1 MFS transporter [Tessaracoccus caeni]
MLSTQATRSRAFTHVLINSAAAGLGTAFIWFGITFWAYLETRSVLATSFLGGAYMLGMAILGVPFGSLIDRYRKHPIMMLSAAGTAVSFVLGGLVFWLTPHDDLISLTKPWFWIFCGLILFGALLAMIRGLALTTCVTMLVESDKRANANGLVGAVNGMTMLVVGVLSGLSIGQLGIGWTLLLAVVVVVASLVHLLFIRIPEPEIVHADGVPSAVDFKGAWRAIVVVPGLIGLIIFSTFNNFLGGVFMSLLDPYGLELMSVEAWGILFGLSSIGFVIGGALIAKMGLGVKPLRTLLFACLAMWVVSGIFTLRDSVWLLAVGVFAYMILVPFIEAAEQTMMQRVVPLEKQGRVFGFAQAVEVSASPLSALLIGPVAQFWLLPYADSDRGQAQWSWLLGTGDARGIALVFVLVSVFGFILTALVFLTRSYRLLNQAYDAGDVNADLTTAPGASDPIPGPNPLGKGHAES